MEEINRYEITEFVIPENPLEITSIWYVEPAYREEYLTVPESERPPKVSPEEVETCLSACPNIESLDISWDYGRFVRENPEQPFGKIITTIVTRALRLKSLSISSNSLLDEHLQEFNQDRFPSLRALRLSDCHRIGAKGIKAIASQCPRLKYLDLHYSLNDDANEAALYIGEYLKELRCLNLHRTCNVLDSGLEAIAKGCPQLEYLELSRNYSLSDHSIKRLSENCHELKFLGMFYNTQVSASGLKYLIENCPHFKCYHHGGWGANARIVSAESDYPQICFNYHQKPDCIEDHFLLD